MPNRILHERICVSETIAELTAEEERFFYRLMVQCDDYGRFDGRPAVLRARCFALQLDTVTDEDVARWMSRLEQVGLAVTYVVDGRAFLRVTTWKRYQQTRAKRSKFPAEDGYEDAAAPPDSVCAQTLDEAGIGHRYPDPVNEKREAMSGMREPGPARERANGATPPPPKKPARSESPETPAPETLEPDATDLAAGEALAFTPAEVRSMSAAMLDHWRARGVTRVDWHAALRSWIRDEPKFHRRPIGFQLPSAGPPMPGRPDRHPLGPQMPVAMQVF